MDAWLMAPDRSTLSISRHLSVVRNRFGANATVGDIKKAGAWHLPAQSVLLLTKKLASDSDNPDLSELIDWTQVADFCWTDRADIDATFMRLLANVHPQRQEIRDMLASGVSPSKMALLYSGDAQSVADAVRERLRHLNMQQFRDVEDALQGSRALANDGFWPTLTVERGFMPELIEEANLRLNPMAKSATEGTYAPEVFRLRETLRTILAWSENHHAVEPVQQVSHVWLVKLLLATPLLDFR